VLGDGFVGKAVQTDSGAGFGMMLHKNGTGKLLWGDGLRRGATPKSPTSSNQYVCLRQALSQVNRQPGFAAPPAFYLKKNILGVWYVKWMASHTRAHSPIRHPP
jgi:hypothetical protein